MGLTKTAKLTYGAIIAIGLPITLVCTDIVIADRWLAAALAVAGGYVAMFAICIGFFIIKLREGGNRLAQTGATGQEVQAYYRSTWWPFLRTCLIAGLLAGTIMAPLFAIIFVPKISAWL